MQKGFIFILILAIIIGVFAISNAGVVKIDFIFAEVEVSQAIVIFICVLLGAIIASIFAGIRQMSLSKEIKNLKAENKELQDEVDVLKVRMKVKEEHDKALKEKDRQAIDENDFKNLNKVNNTENTNIDKAEKNDFYER